MMARGVKSRLKESGPPAAGALIGSRRAISHLRQTRLAMGLQSPAWASWWRAAWL